MDVTVASTWYFGRRFPRVFSSCAAESAREWGLGEIWDHSISARRQVTPQQFTQCPVLPCARPHACCYSVLQPRAGGQLRRAGCAPSSVPDEDACSAYKPSVAQPEWRVSREVDARPRDGNEGATAHGAAAAGGISAHAITRSPISRWRWVTRWPRRDGATRSTGGDDRSAHEESDRRDGVEGGGSFQW